MLVTLFQVICARIGLWMSGIGAVSFALNLHAYDFVLRIENVCQVVIAYHMQHYINEVMG